MQQSFGWRRKLLLFCAILVIPASIFAGISVGEQAPQTPLTPSQLHELLSQQKAVALERSREFSRRSMAAPTAQTNYDVKFYDVDIRVNDTTEVLYGVVKFVSEAVDPSVSSIDFDLRSNMVIDSIVSPAGVLSSSRNVDVVSLTLDRTYNQGEQFEFTVYYNGHPTQGGFQAFSFGWYGGKRSISSLSEPYYARTWWPCKDRMDDKADSFYIAIEVDTSFYVGSNGTLDSVVSNGGNSEVYFYTERYPMATYLFSMAIHPFTVWTDEYVTSSGLDSMPIVNAVYPDQYATSLTGWGIIPQAIAALVESYGEYPFLNEKYGHANFEWGGGMEHQTMTSMTGSWFGFYEPVVVHELGHQWFGDMITCKSWSDIWLNEGWASYSEALFYLKTEGWASYHSYMNGMRYTGGGTIYVYDTTSIGNIFNGGLSYDKGAWVAHMLRGVLGDSLFFVGVDSFFNSQYRFGAATTEDFKNVIENATGQELDWFFNQWIYDSYYPNYRYQLAYKWVPTGGYENYIYVEQIQIAGPQFFTMPVDFFVDYSSGPDDTVSLFVDKRAQVLKFVSPYPALNVKLDPSDWILKSASAQPWSFHIVTLQSEISQANQYESYSYTISTIGGTGLSTSSVSTGSLPTGLNLDIAGIISGVPLDTGVFTFGVLFENTSSGFSDEQQFTINVSPAVLVPGDIDLSGGTVDIGDLTVLIGYLFINGPTPLEENLADVNADCLIDIGDITDLIGYLFIQGSPPVMGCVN